MNHVTLMGRLTRDPDIRQAQDGSLIARYTLAVDRPGAKGDVKADFIGCVAFGKSAEFAERWMHKGEMFAIEGRIQTGSYTNREGQKVYTTDIIVSRQFFTGNRGQGATPQEPAPRQAAAQEREDFMNVPEDMEEYLPFN